MKKLFYVYFAGTSNKTAIQAETRNEARQIFAEMNKILLSDYIVTSKTNF